MVNQTEQSIDSNQPPVSTGDTTTDVTEEFSSVDTFEDASTIPEDLTTAPSSSEGQEDINQASPSPSTAPLVTGEAPPVDPVPPPQNDNVMQRMSMLEEQAAQYKNMQMQQQLQIQSEQYKDYFEQQGLMPDQAERMAKDFVTQQGQTAKMQKDHEDYVLYLQGQSNAAEHFATQYSLNLPDLAELKRYQDPQSMEAAAKRIKGDRDKDAEIARLKAQLVPSQSYDDSQSTPAASNSENGWLDRYNQGDRSEQAKAAARRAAGLG